MKKVLPILSAVLFMATFVLGTASAQMMLSMPQPSPAASVMHQVGFNEISIDYSSPGVKDRKVFGELLPYGVTWRAGANAATKLSFSTPVTINGKNLNAGEYTIFVTPEKDEWVFHLNSKGKSVYDYMKDRKIDEDALAADDAVMVEANVEKAPFAERLAYYISATDNNKAIITLHWADKMASFEVDVRTDWLMERMKGAF